MDEAVPIPGTRFRFGLDGLLGLIPGVGDLAGGLVSTWFLIAAARLGAPPSVLARMGSNVAVDALFGAVPLIGDLFDFGWKANRRNLALLERFLADPRGTHRASRAWIFTALGILLALLLVLLVGVAVAAAVLVRWILGHR